MDLSQLLESIVNRSGLWVLPAAAVGLALLFVLALWMGAALAGLERLTFVKALWIAPLQMVLLAPAGFGIFSMIFGSDMREWLTLQHFALGLGLTLIVDLVLVLVALLLVEARPVQGLILWLLRLPILGLLSALVSGGVFISIAIYQAANEPQGQVWLTWIGWIFAGVVVLALALFFGTRLTQSASGGPRRTAA